jgi:hypothetical protein
MHDWKSTASGILTGLIGTLTSIMSFQVPMDLLNPQQTRAWLYITVGCNLAAIIGKVWLGLITKNADASAVAGAINNAAQAGAGAYPVTTADLTTPTAEVK